MIRRVLAASNLHARQLGAVSKATQMMQYVCMAVCINSNSSSAAAPSSTLKQQGLANQGNNATSAAVQHSSCASTTHPAHGAHAATSSRKTGSKRHLSEVTDGNEEGPAKARNTGCSSPPSTSAQAAAHQPTQQSQHNALKRNAAQQQLASVTTKVQKPQRKKKTTISSLSKHQQLMGASIVNMSVDGAAAVAEQPPVQQKQRTSLSKCPNSNKRFGAAVDSSMRPSQARKIFTAAAGAAPKLHTAASRRRPSGQSTLPHTAASKQQKQRLQSGSTYTNPATAADRNNNSHAKQSPKGPLRAKPYPKGQIHARKSAAATAAAKIVIKLRSGVSLKHRKGSSIKLKSLKQDKAKATTATTVPRSAHAAASTVCASKPPPSAAAALLAATFSPSAAVGPVRTNKSRTQQNSKRLPTTAKSATAAAAAKVLKKVRAGVRKPGTQAVKHSSIKQQRLTKLATAIDETAVAALPDSAAAAVAAANAINALSKSFASWTLAEPDVPAADGPPAALVNSFAGLSIASSDKTQAAAAVSAPPSQGKRRVIRAKRSQDIDTAAAATSAAALLALVAAFGEPCASNNSNNSCKRASESAADDDSSGALVGPKRFRL